MRHRIIFIISLLTSQLFFAQSITVKEPIRYLALGDSYTIGQSVDYNNRWPSLLFDSLNQLNYATDTLTYIARTGWRTDNLISALDEIKPDSNYNMVSLLIGVNNQYQNSPFSKYQSEFPELLNRAIALANGDTNAVFVLSIPDYAYTPFGNGSTSISSKLNEYDNFARDICFDLGVNFFYITDLSREGLNNPELVAIDGLHPSGKQYKLYRDLILSNGIITGTKKNETKIDLSFTNPTSPQKLLKEIPDFIQTWKLINLEGETILDATKTRIGLKPGFYIFQGIDSNERLYTSSILLK